MAKNILKYLNHGDGIWVDILYDKYGKENFWKDKILSKCSWFFRGLCHSAFFLKKFFKINSISPTQTSFLFDPWCFDIPIAYKPTYIHMLIDLNQIIMSNLLVNNQWDVNKLVHIFGLNVNLFAGSMSTIDDLNYNFRVWEPPSSKTLYLDGLLGSAPNY